MARINVNCYIVILLTISHQACTLVRQQRQMPGPDISALKDDGPPLRDSNDFMPAVMMALNYYAEMMQYEIVVNSMATTTKRTTPRPTMTTTRRTTTPTRRTTTTTRRTTQRSTTVQTTQRPTTITTRPTTTTQRPTTTTVRSTTRQTTRTTSRPPTRQTTRTTTKPAGYQTVKTTTPATILYQTFKPHAPGVQAPEKPPYYIYFNIPIKPEQSYYHRPGIQQQAHGITSIGQPDWQNPEFFSWFFQKKPAYEDDFDENELQYLDVLPKKLLLDIHRDSKRRPAILDYDNVIEFRKIYDDSYNYRNKVSTPNSELMKMNMKIQMQQQRPMLTGKKKAPPTRPYVLFLMLYDLLKKEAKTKKLHEYKGFSDEMIRILDAHSQTTGVDQLKYFLEQMIERQEVTVPDIVARTNVILADLRNERSDAYKTLTLIPPLPFRP